MEAGRIGGLDKYGKEPAAQGIGLFLNSPFPVSPSGGKPGRAGSPHAGSTLRTSKMRCHASMLPAPPTRGLPPPCESPARESTNGVDKEGPSHGSRDRKGAICQKLLLQLQKGISHDNVLPAQPCD